MEEEKDDGLDCRTWKASVEQGQDRRGFGKQETAEIRIRKLRESFKKEKERGVKSGKSALKIRWRGQVEEEQLITSTDKMNRYFHSKTNRFHVLGILAQEGPSGAEVWGTCWLYPLTTIPCTSWPSRDLANPSKTHRLVSSAHLFSVKTYLSCVSLFNNLGPSWVNE